MDEKQAESAKTVPEIAPEPETAPVAEAAVLPEFTAGGKIDHTGTVCPFCTINGACGHPVKFPAVCGAAPWVPNAWVKGP